MSGSAASSWMLKDRGPRMLEAEPEVTSAVDIFVKDLAIVLDTGRDTKAALPLAAAAHQMFLSVSGRGVGAADDSQVIRSYFTWMATNDRHRRSSSVEGSFLFKPLLVDARSGCLLRARL